MAKTLDLLMRNRIVSREEALAVGLVHEVAPPDQLMERAMAPARELATGPQAAMRMLKRTIYNASEMPLPQVFDEIAAKTAITDNRPDAREGVAAFREKRPARFA